MSPIKCLSVILFASLCCNAATAKLNSTKYTVTFEYEDGTSCLGGILGEKILISAVECFADRNGEVFNFTSIKAVVGSVKVKVDKVRVPKYPPRKGTVLRDYALVWLKQNLNLKKNGLTALTVPIRKTKVSSWGFVSKDNENQPKKFKIVNSQNCLNNVDLDFIPASHLCVKLPNAGDHCLNRRGSPMVTGRSGIIYIIGLNLGCYESSPYEVFANIYSGLGKRSEFFPFHVYP